MEDKRVTLQSTINPERVTVNPKQEYVWYTSYGSNLSDNRFPYYIHGGQPVGSTRTYEGCRNKSAPLASMPVDIPQQLYFAGNSKVWLHEKEDGQFGQHSGRAYITLETGKEPTKARAYLITKEQFEDVLAQENRLESIDPINVNNIRHYGRAPVGLNELEPGSYDELLYCGEHDGFAAISFTSGGEVQPYTKPSRRYLTMIASGLIEAHGMTADSVAEYLSTKPGIIGNWAVKDLVTLVA
jgi:hypothetical protein